MDAKFTTKSQEALSAAAMNASTALSLIHI